MLSISDSLKNFDEVKEFFESMNDVNNPVVDGFGEGLDFYISEFSRQGWKGPLQGVVSADVDGTQGMSKVIWDSKDKRVVGVYDGHKYEVYTIEEGRETYSNTLINNS